MRGQNTLCTGLNITVMHEESSCRDNMPTEQSDVKMFIFKGIFVFARFILLFILYPVIYFWVLMLN